MTRATAETMIYKASAFSEASIAMVASGTQRT